MSRRILVIDDEDDIREIVRLALARLAGWVVADAATGEAGLLLAQQQSFDAVLLDMMMPGCDGEATARLLRAEPGSRAMPIVLLSAAAELPAWADELGVRGLLRKPFDPAQLPDQVSAILNW